MEARFRVLLQTFTVPKLEKKLNCVTLYRVKRESFIGIVTCLLFWTSVGITV